VKQQVGEVRCSRWLQQLLLAFLCLGAWHTLDE
jgi:hypothetical protein